MARYRIDALAQASGVTVRNIRAYQDQGLLPPPVREGRVGIYSDAHLTRLRLITRLLGRGYTIATITDLLQAWTHGRDISDILGLEQVVAGFWDEEIPSSVTREELYELFGQTDTSEPDLVERAVQASLVEPTGEQEYRVASPRLLYSIAGLVSAGAPLGAVLEFAGRMARALDSAVQNLLESFYEQLLRGHAEDWMPSGSEISDLTSIAQRLRPMTAAAVSVLVNRSLAQNVDEVIGSYIARVMPNLRPGLRGDASTA